ncbi:DUF4244 domain-containing protein [Arthrobacter sp. MSA 4-2]|uniref:DUF4244 domain-containing protein n=1 Tax=Arthrobacter sp. MSA 4-2 TaxID=2794349 RepID=UPI001E5B9B62|nr:DUF4244 domain-containing protein [Arthrobacter sp. MSA 4-2]
MAKTILSPAVRLPGRAVPMTGRFCRCSTASNTPHTSPGPSQGGADPAASASAVPGPSLPDHVPSGMREAGLATAEYAIVTLAAVGFAALLVAVLSSGEIRGMLMSLITNALSFG